jgi:hypothetical protein
MTSRSTIVGITRQSPKDAGFEASDDSQLSAFETNEPPYELEEDQAYIVADDSYDTQTDDVTTNWKSYIIQSLLLLSLTGWTGFFIWVNRAIDFSAFGDARIVPLVSGWAIPAILIGLIWLIALRNSRSEAKRFGDVSNLLRTESEALEVRMRTVNEEISLAREFLAQNARELESLGRHSADKLIEASQQLNEALADSDIKAKALETVSSAAASNLEQLRKHLPVVTSAAKDVTNQIGSAGNSAQLQVKTLIAGLQRVADAGKSARDNVEGLEVRAGEAAIQLSHIISRNAQLLQNSITDASERTQGISTLLGEASGKITNELAAASEDIGALVDINAAKLSQQVILLQKSLSDLSAQSQSEDERVSNMIERITAHIDERTTVLSNLDEASADRAVKLAFAVEALITSTKILNDDLANSSGATDELTQRSEQLLRGLNKAKSELEQALPIAIETTEARLLESVNSVQKITQNALSLDVISDDLLAKLNTVQHLMSQQSAAVNELLNANDAQFVVHRKQADAMATTLVETRAMIEMLSDSANIGLVDTLHKIQEGTQNAADASKLFFNTEIGTASERLFIQTRESLAHAIDTQVSELNAIVQKSLSDNIALSESATEGLSAKLARIDTMTANLEARIDAAHEGFDGMDENSFARQMLLLTESLNSTAIDVAKILSNEVADTAWAAYLKGDRGVFTRRAVRLLDTSEAKMIATHYSEEPEFKEYVNRYIHDFEAMMRVLLSTRDGNAVGVTLLSSDVGKLYVALAQAIERLRN